MRVARILIAITAIVVGVSLILAIPSGAHATKPPPTPTTKVLTSAVDQPFNLEVRHGTVLVADGGPGIIGKVRSDRTVKTLISGATGTSGIATSGHGKYLAYTTTTGGQAGITASGVTITGPRGYVAKADTLEYEQENNPDSGNHYGLQDSTQCTASGPAPAGAPPPSYTGLIDSHAYSLAAWGKGFVLADAGANALLRISRDGKKISTLAVLPPQPSTVTPEVAAMYGLKCSGNVVYNFEPVPTDVEVGPDGYLYVTTLPGGPEDPSLGARGKVYRVNPWNGKVKQVAKGLLGPTNLAISGGKLYVAEAFAGRISVIKHGRVSAYLPLPGALAIEAGHGGKLYAATGIFGPPSVVRIDTRKGWRH